MQHAEMQINGQVNGPWLKEQDRGLTAGVSLWTRCVEVHADVIAAPSLLSGHLDLDVQPRPCDGFYYRAARYYRTCCSDP